MEHKNSLELLNLFFNNVSPRMAHELTKSRLSFPYDFRMLFLSPFPETMGSSNMRKNGSRYTQNWQT